MLRENAYTHSVSKPTYQKRAHAALFDVITLLLHVYILLLCIVILPIVLWYFVSIKAITLIITVITSMLASRSDIIRVRTC